MIDAFADPASAPFALNRPGLVAGLGLRGEAAAVDVLSLLDECLTSLGRGRADMVALATLETRGDHPALVEAARELSVPIIALSPDRLCPTVPNPSRRVRELAGVPSVAEAAALCFGPLLAQKRPGTHVTCALSLYSPVVETGSASAAMAASMLATSSAGP